MLWDAAHGMRRLVDILAIYGVTVPPDWTLRQQWMQASLLNLLPQIDAKTQNCGMKKGSFFVNCTAADTLDDYLQDALLWLPAKEPRRHTPACRPLARAPRRRPGAAALHGRSAQVRLRPRLNPVVVK